MTSWQSLVADLRANPAVMALDEGQVDAIVDVLAVAVFADSCVAHVEVAEFNEMVAELPWSGCTERERRARIRASLARAKGATDEAARRTLLASAAGRLTDQWLREKVLEMAATIAGSDLDLAPAERSVLVLLAEAFGIDAARSRAIIDKSGSGA